MPDIAPIENPQSTQPLDDAAIARLQNDLPDDEILYDLAELFRVFGDSTRIKILYALFESELCVNDIAQVVGISQSAVSHQLRLLKTSKLVKFRREGKAMYYSLDDDHVRSMIALRATASPPGGEAFKLRYPILKITIYKGDCHHAEEIQDRSRLRELRRQN